MKHKAVILFVLALPLAVHGTKPGEIFGPDQFSFSEPFPSESNPGRFVLKWTLTNTYYTTGLGFRQYVTCPGAYTNLIRTVRSMDDVAWIANNVEKTLLHVIRRKVTVDGPEPWMFVGTHNFITNQVNPFRGYETSRLAACGCGDYEFMVLNYGTRDEHYAYVDYSGAPDGEVHATSEPYPGPLISSMLAHVPMTPHEVLNRDEVPENRINRSHYGWFRVRQFSSRFRNVFLSESAEPPQEVVPVSMEELTGTEKLGFDVTNLVQSTFGVSVAWRTDAAPPYRVVLRRMAEIENPGAKVLGEVVTYDDHAFITGDFTDVSTFVQVGTVRGVRSGARVTRQEYDAYVAWVRSLPQADGLNAIMPPGKTDFVQTGDGKWSVFKKSGENRFSFDVNGYFADDRSVVAADDYRLHLTMNVGEGLPPETRTDHVVREFVFPVWSVIPVSVVTSPAFVIPDAALLVGTGYRITVDETSGEFGLARAYSSSETASDKIIVPRPWKALSAHLGLKFTIDWLGTPTMQPETDAAQGVIYWNGL